jgi:hypothetical protein
MFGLCSLVAGQLIHQDLEKPKPIALLEQSQGVSMPWRSRDSGFSGSSITSGGQSHALEETPGP